jgi:hypothetical protein
METGINDKRGVTHTFSHSNKGAVYEKTELMVILTK